MDNFVLWFISVNNFVLLGGVAFVIIMFKLGAVRVRQQKALTKRKLEIINYEKNPLSKGLKKLFEKLAAFFL